MRENLFMNEQKGKLAGLLPIGVFLVLFLGVGIATKDFYSMPAIVAFLIALVVAFLQNKKCSFQEKVHMIAEGVGDDNIITMCLIFLAAGAFSGAVSAAGGVDSTVALGLSLLPAGIVVAGLMIIGCFISVSMGTSMGTIGALAPIAIGISEQTGYSMAICIGAVVSGAMFGDNLSFISDTTIAATRTQGCKMADKFRTNFLIVMPFALLTTILYIFAGSGAHNTFTHGAISWIKVLPYVAVLTAAVAGVNVMVVLLGGTVLCGVIGLLTGAFDVWGWTTSMGAGINSMGELIIVTLLAGGMLEMIRYNGGLTWIIEKTTAHISGRKGAELSIAGVVSFANLCTANNTIALIMAGPIAKEIAQKYNIAPNRSASLLDIFSCFVQGMIPYGAQLLMAASLSGVSPVHIMKYLYYPYLLGIGTLIAIWLGFPRKYTKPAEAPAS